MISDKTLEQREKLQKEAEYARIMFRMCGIGVTAKTADLLLRVSKRFEKKKGKMDIGDHSELEAQWEADWKKQLSETDIAAEDLP